MAVLRGYNSDATDQFHSKKPAIAWQIFTVDARGFPVEFWEEIAPAQWRDASSRQRHTSPTSAAGKAPQEVVSDDHVAARKAHRVTNSDRPRVSRTGGSARDDVREVGNAP